MLLVSKWWLFSTFSPGFSWGMRGVLCYRTIVGTHIVQWARYNICIAVVSVKD